MRLEHHLSVPAPIDVVWPALLDPERVAPCMPGATLTGVDGDSFTGTVKVKVGPIALLYKGTGTFTEHDEQARRAVLKAAAKDARGNGTVNATVTLTLTEAGDHTTGTVATDLSITGKPAQFGRGMIADVGGKIIEQFAACLSDKLAAPVAVAEPEPGRRPAQPEGARHAGASEAEPFDLMRYVRGSALQRIGPWSRRRWWYSSSCCGAYGRATDSPGKNGCRGGRPLPLARGGHRRRGPDLGEGAQLAESLDVLTGGERFDGCARRAGGARRRRPHPVCGAAASTSTTSGRTPSTRAGCGGAPRWTSTAAEPEWEVLLDLDALAAAEDENWVWQGADVLRPDYPLLISCPGAAPTPRWCASSTWRTRVRRRRLRAARGEERRRLDRPRHVFVGTDFGPGSLTNSGYPRIVKRWRRGHAARRGRDRVRGRARRTSCVRRRARPDAGLRARPVGRRLDFFHARRLRLRGGELSGSTCPTTPNRVHREWLLVRLRSAWAVGDDHLSGRRAAGRPVRRVPRGQARLHGRCSRPTRTPPELHAWTRNHLVLATLADVSEPGRTSSRPGRGQRRRSPAPAPSDHHRRSSTPTGRDDDSSISTGFDFTDHACCCGRAGGESTELKQRAGLLRRGRPRGRQHFATSADGTGCRTSSSGTTPTATGPDPADRLRRLRDLADAGLQRRRRPGLAGPGRHLRGRQHPGRRRVRPALAHGGAAGEPAGAYEDFAAVASDLVDARHHHAARLGIQGGSNGGLLMGVMLTRYPELFGAIVCGAAARHAALPPAAGRGVVDGRVRRPGRAGRLGVHLASTRRTTMSERTAIPAGAVHDLHPRRPGAPRPRPQDAAALDARARPRRHVLREHRGRPRRRGRQRAGRIPVARWSSSSCIACLGADGGPPLTVGRRCGAGRPVRRRACAARAAQGPAGALCARLAGMLAQPDSADR